MSNNFDIQSGSGSKDNAAKKLVEALWDGEDDVPNVKSFGDVQDLDSWMSSLAKAVSVEDLESVAKQHGTKFKGNKNRVAKLQQLYTLFCD